MSKPIKENSFDAAPGGTAGSINFQTSLGTHSSPTNYQDPAKFVSSDYNKYYDKLKTGQPDTQTTADGSGSFNKDVDQLFKAKEKPTVDDVLCGVQYELQNMIKKDKRMAKEIVLQNLKKYGAKYYTKLQHMNIDDKEMDVEPISHAIVENTQLPPEMQERIKILDKMVADREAKREPMKINSAIQDILRDKREQKFNRTTELFKRIS